jgi:ParB family chromosome partitioning protein
MEAHASDSSGAPRRRLGRGLSALLGSRDDQNDGHQDILPLPRSFPSGGSETPNHEPDATAAAAAPGSDEIALELIERSPFQPRREFDQAALDELADSIRRHGILQPLLVRTRPDGESGYQLIAGERRWRAAQQVGLETVPCRVIPCEDQQASEAALEENLKREDLNVLDKAVAFRDYLNRFGGTIEDLGRQLSMNRATVSNMLRLLELPADIQQLVRDGRLSGGHAKALLALPESQQLELARRIVAEQMSVRHTEEVVRELLKAPTTTAPAESSADASPLPETSRRPALTKHVLSLQDFLRGHLGAKVEIRIKKSEAGQIVIHFGNSDDFERLVGRLRTAG